MHPEDMKPHLTDDMVHPILYVCGHKALLLLLLLADDQGIHPHNAHDAVFCLGKWG